MPLYADTICDAERDADAHFFSNAYSECDTDTYFKCYPDADIIGNADTLGHADADIECNTDALGNTDTGILHAGGRGV